MTSRKLTAIDLFSGGGGLSLGLKQAGFNIKVSVEIDDAAARTYKMNHPDTLVIEKDIREISTEELIKTANLHTRELDLMAGCPPCQGFSRIKNRNKSGVDDPRNNFILEFLRLALGVRPKLVLLENVPALIHDHRFKKFIASLEASGYKTTYKIMNAADFGVPQRRKRLIMMASRVGDVSLPEPSNLPTMTVRDYISGLEDDHTTNDPLHRMYLKNTDRIKALIKRIPKNGGSRSALPMKEQLACHKRVAGFRDIYGRMKWDDVAPTLTGGCFNPSKGRFLHPVKNRAITMREAALLQTFPRNYIFIPEMGLSKIARIIGDALPPKFGEAQGRHLSKLLAV